MSVNWKTWSGGIAAAAKAHVETCSFGTKQDTCGLGNYPQLGQISTYFTSPYADAGKLIEQMLSQYETQGQTYTLTSDKCGTEPCFGYRQVQQNQFAFFERNKQIGKNQAIS